MSFSFAVYATSIVAALAVSGYMALHAARHQTVPGARPFMWMSVLVGWLALTEGLSVVAPTGAWAHIWFDARFLSLAAAPAVWLLFVLEYSGNPRLPGMPPSAALFIVPAVTLAMIWTNDFHGWWVQKPVTFLQSGPFWFAQTASRIVGPWMRVHLLYSYALTLAGLTVLAVTSLRADRQNRGQIIAVGLGTLIMTVAAALPTVGLPRNCFFNPLVPGMTIGLLVIFYGARRFRFLQSPLAIRKAPAAPVPLVFLFVFLACGIMAAGYRYYTTYENSYRIEVERSLSSIVELKVAEIVQWRKERLADAALLYENDHFAKMVRQIIDHPNDTAAQRAVHAWLEKLRVSYQYENVILFSASGSIRLSALDKPQTAYREIREGIPELRRSPKVMFLDLHRKQTSDRISFSILVPIISDDRFWGVVALIIDPSVYLYPMIQRWPTPSKTAETLLVRKTGNQVEFLNELRFQKSTALRLRFPLSQTDLPAVMTVLGKEGVAEGVDYRGVPVIAALKKVPNSPWFMVARMDQQEIYAPIREHLLLMVLLVCTLIAGAAVGVWIFWQRQRNIFYRREARTARELRTSEEKFRKAFMTSPDAVMIARLSDGVIISVNADFLRSTGYREDEMIGKTAGDLHLWKNDADRRQLTERLKVEGFVNNFESSFTNKRGDVIDGLLSASIIDLKGVSHVVTITRDITERKRIEEQLRESEDKFKYIFDNSVVGKSITAPDGKMTVNKALGYMLGYAEGELEGLHWQDITHPDDIEMTRLAIEQMLAGKEASVRFVKRFLRKDRTVVWVDLSSSLRRAKDGTPLYLISTMVDITEQRLVQNALQQLNEELDHRVKQRTAELEEKIEELARLNRLFVDRELRMRDLKIKIAQLEKAANE